MKNSLEQTQTNNQTQNKGNKLKKDFYSVWRILANNEKMESYRLLDAGEFKDVILCRAYSGKTLSNLPRRFGGADRYTWGYDGNGPSELARSTLLHFSNDDLAFTHSYAREFVEEIIQHLPMDESVVISHEFILDWIKESRKSKPKYEVVYKPEACGSDFVYNDDYQVIKRPQINDKKNEFNPPPSGGKKYVR